MITIDSSPAPHFDPGSVESLPITGGRLAWKRQSWNDLRLLVCESWVARVALAIIVALVVFAGLQLLGVFDFVAGWPVLRNVAGWVGQLGAVGGAAAAAAAAGVGDPGAPAVKASAAGAKAAQKVTGDAAVKVERARADKKQSDSADFWFYTYNIASETRG